MNARLGRMVVVRTVSVQTLLDLTRVNVIQATLETDLFAQVLWAIAKALVPWLVH